MSDDRVFILARALERIIVELDDVNGWLPTALQPNGEVYETAREVLRGLGMEPERPAPAPLPSESEGAPAWEAFKAVAMVPPERAEPGPCSTPTLRPPGRNGDESAYDHDAPAFCVCGWRMDSHPAPRSSEEPRCATCGGGGRIYAGDPNGPWPCPDCGGSARAAPGGTRP